MLDGSGLLTAGPATLMGLSSSGLRRLGFGWKPESPRVQVGR